MDHRHRIAVALLAMLVITGPAAATVSAQPPNGPLDEPPELKLPPPPQGENPAVEAVLDSNPTTLAEQVRAAKILADLGRPELGKDLLRQALGARPSRQQLAALVERFGSSTLMGLAARRDLQPEAKQLAKAALTAAQQTAEDPQRLADLIKRLEDPSSRQRAAAMSGLMDAHSAAVGAMIDVLIDPGRTAEHARVRAALVQMGLEAVGPMVALLEADDPQTVIQAIRVLASLDSKPSSIYLLRPYHSEATDPRVRAVAGAALRRLAGRVPGRRQSVRLLRDRAKAGLDRRQPGPDAIDARVDLYRWDAAGKRCIGKSLPAEDAALIDAARLARDAHALDEDDREIRLLHLATMLQAAAYEHGLQRPLPEGEGTAMAEASRFSVAVIEDLLGYAMAADHTAAAAAAARILGRSGTADVLLRQGEQPSKLVRATRSGDRRLRLAAADAVVRLQPAGPFPGCSYVAESLAFFAASSGPRRVLVAGPSTEGSLRLAGRLAQLGFDVDTALTGREAMRLAVGSPDYELAMIDAAIQGPTADLLLQQLRRDCRTADLRVGLIARSGYLTRAEQIAGRDPMALAFSRPHTDEAIGWQVEQLATLSPRTFVGHAERSRQAAEALGRLAELSGSERRLYDVRRLEGSVLKALYAPELSSRAAAVLANVNSVQSQQALVELASRWTQPLAARAAAAKAFRQSTQRHGILLRTAEIARQYDRYNASEDLDQDTQRILGLILDCIEAPTMPVKPKQEGEEVKVGSG